MVAETAMGMLTAAGTTLLPFFLFRKMNVAGPPPLGEILMLVSVASTPFAVASAEHGIAMQSRYYSVEQWPAQVAGIASQAAVLGLYYLLDGPSGTGSSSFFSAVNAGEMALLVGSIGIVPVAEMMALNFFKTPRHQVPFGGFGAVRYTPEGGLQVAAPTPQPLFSASRGNALDGVMVPVASGRF
jgi:hypothetical protein